MFHNLLEGVVGVVPDPFVNHSFAAEMEDLVDVNDDGFETAVSILIIVLLFLDRNYLIHVEISKSFKYWGLT